MWKILKAMLRLWSTYWAYEKQLKAYREAFKGGSPSMPVSWEEAARLPWTEVSPKPDVYDPLLKVERPYDPLLKVALPKPWHEVAPMPVPSPDCVTWTKRTPKDEPLESWPPPYVVLFSDPVSVDQAFGGRSASITEPCEHGLRPSCCLACQVWGPRS